MRPFRRLARLLLFLCTALLLSACGNDAQTTFQGYAEGDYLYAASPFAGRLEELHVSKGQRAAAKQPLFRLDATEETAALIQAESTLSAAKSELRDMLAGARPEELAVIQAEVDRAAAEAARARRQRDRDNAQFKAGGISAAERDASQTRAAESAARLAEAQNRLATAHLAAREDRILAQEARVQAARAAVTLAAWRLEQKNILSPTEALVADTIFQPGEQVPAARPVVKLLPPESIKVRFFVPEKSLSLFRPGTKVTALSDAPGGQAEGIPCSVTFISPEAEYTPPIIYSNETRAKLTFMLEAVPEHPEKLNPGQPLSVSLP